MKVDVYINGKLVHTVIGYNNEDGEELLARVKATIEVHVYGSKRK